MPPRGATDAAFEEREADDGRGNAEEDVDGVVVAGIDGCPPDAYAYQGKHRRPHGQLACAQGIEAGDGAVGGVERRHGGEDIGVVDIDAAEDGVAHEGVEASEAGRVAASVEDRFETEFLDVPWRSCRVDVISDEADEVHEEEGCRKMEGLAAAAAKEEVETEGQGQRHPTEIADAGQYVEGRSGMERKPFVGRQSGRSVAYAEQRLLGLIDATDVDVANEVVGVIAHRVVDEPEQDEWHHCHYEFTKCQRSRFHFSLFRPPPTPPGGSVR